MSPALLATILVAVLLALVPVWRLRVAGWPPRSLFTAWILYAVGIFIAVRFPGPVRVLVPILVLAYVAPFVAGPERLSRVLNGRRGGGGVIIDVTPRPAPELPEAPGRAGRQAGRDHGSGPDDGEPGAGA
ncbi:MAG: hypothetical protein AB1627_02135 [Chloroflexota bacterium]